MMDKKGSEKINAGMFLLYLLIIGFGVVITVGIYLGDDSVNVRHRNVEVLYEKIMNCIVSGGFVNSDVMDADYNIFSSCSINKNVIDSYGYYFEISLVNSSGAIIKKIYGGNQSNRAEIKTDCEIVYDKRHSGKNFCMFANETYLMIENESVKNVKVVSWLALNNNGEMDNA